MIKCLLLSFQIGNDFDCLFSLNRHFQKRCNALQIKIKTIYMIFWSNSLPICMQISGFSITKSVANLKISWSFLLEKILRSTRTLDCHKYRLKLKPRFFSFCWAIFLCFSTPVSGAYMRASETVIQSTNLWTFCINYANLCKFIQNQWKMLLLCHFLADFDCLFSLIGLGAGFKT